MNNDDYAVFCDLLDDAYDLIGSGTNKIISGGAKSLFFAALENYSLPTVRAALSAHCLDRTRGRFTPKPADIIEQIEGAIADDGRLGSDEAWAIAITSRDEADTVVWTQEIAEAFSVCAPVLDMGDEVGARMAFKDAYSRIVAKARNERQPIQWFASLGWDKAKRNAVLQKAEIAGLLAAPVVSNLLLQNGVPSMPVDSVASEQIKNIKDMLARMNAEKQRETELYAQREREATSAAKRDAREKTEAYAKAKTDTP